MVLARVLQVMAMDGEAGGPYAIISKSSFLNAAFILVTFNVLRPRLGTDASCQDWTFYHTLCPSPT